MRRQVDSHTKIVKNTGILMGMELGLKGLDVLLSVILARYLAPQGFGLFAFALSFVSLFSILPGFGMGTLTTRNLARDSQPLNRYLWNGLVAKALLSMATLALISLVMWGTGSGLLKTQVVVLAGLCMALDATLRFTTAFFQAAQRMTTVALVNLGSTLGWVIAAFLVVWRQGGVLELLGVRALVGLTTVLVSVWLIHVRLYRLSWTFDPAFMRQMLRDAFPFVLIKIFVLLYMDIDMVMLSFMKGDVITGWYAAAQKFWRAFLFIPFSMRDAVMPAMAKVARESPTELVEHVTRSCRYLLMISLPIAGGIFVLADRLIVLVYGSAYEAAVPAMRILIWAMPLVFVNNVLTPALGALDQERQVSWYLGAGAVFNILTNLIAISRWGHVGAAATTVLSHALVLFLQVHLFRRALSHTQLSRPRLFGQTLKPLGATAAMMTFAWVSQGGGIIPTILVSAAVYVGCLIASRAVGPAEWALINGVVRRG